MGIKPKVIGYECVEWAGMDNRYLCNPIMNKQELIESSMRDLAVFGVKSRYRPIYSLEKEETYDRVYRYIRG